MYIKYQTKMFCGQSIESAYPIIKETIPQSNLGYNANNRYPGFPPLMNDGRSIIAGNRSETLLHNSIVKQSGEVNNAKYRQYMISNASSIMETDFRNASNDVGYYERFVDQISSNVVGTQPYVYNTIVDNNRPLGYSESDLKSIYLSREQLEARRVAPSVSTTKNN
jgi:hypothetical protein